MRHSKRPRLTTERCWQQSTLVANQREHALGLAAVKTELAAVKTELAEFRQETRATSRSVDEQLAELKDLIIGRRDGQ